MTDSQPATYAMRRTGENDSKIMYQVRQKSNPLKAFAAFLTKRLEFQCEILDVLCDYPICT